MVGFPVRGKRSVVLLTATTILMATIFLSFYNYGSSIHKHLFQYERVRKMTTTRVNVTKNDTNWKNISSFGRTPSFDNYTCDKSVNGADTCKMIEGRITEAEHTAMIDNLRDFVRLAENRSWTYWLHAGSLLGSWRHHGMIKWDTDIDIFVDIKNRSDLIQTYDSLKDVFGYFVYHQNVLVFYQNRSIVRSNKYPNEKWPYIDIVFYTKDATHIWAVGWPGSFSKTKHPKRDVFPLKKRPFEGMMVNSPCHPMDYFKLLYGDISQCKTHGYNHKVMAGDKIIQRSCEVLHDLLPYVHRTSRNGTLEEVLIFRKKLLHKVTVNI
ncbi:ribitol 5-phosphate transferase FKRP-like [Lineus longissimus]|uniref:ribitol 5-phosphate transferase FKRP-like n=1 Tax=Lineus longissimus TaxID=88925 RepID=UPI00315DFE7B